MKHAAWIVVFALAASAARAQKPPVKPRSEDKQKDENCLAKNVKKVKFDERCGGYVLPDEEKGRIDKEGKCLKCSYKLPEHEVCEKIIYKCKGCGVTGKKPEPCPTASCKKVKLVKEHDFSRMVWRCAGPCGKKDYDEQKLCEDLDCEGYHKKYVRVCEKSPAEPHNKDF